MKIVSLVFKTTILIGTAIIFSCSANKSATDQSNVAKYQINNSLSGSSLTIKIENGKSHNHPTFAIWLEDMDENYIQTIFVTKSIATGIFGHGPLETEKWDTKPGWQKRPAALPYWIHKRNPEKNGPLLPDPDHKVPDAYTGATPLGNAMVEANLDNLLKGKVRILLEVNQPWDWNDFWTNKLYDDPEYRTSCQPSLIYAVIIDPNQPEKEYYLNPIGHGHYSGENGDLFTDLTTITTAKDIFRKISVQFNN